VSDVTPTLRIGEIARRCHVSTDLLRAWERRYGLLQPVRSPGGLRLYTEDDERRVRAMRARLAEGLSAAEAARAVLEQGDVPPVESPASPIEPLARELARALDSFDDAAAHEALDRLFARFTLDTVAVEVILPYLREIGERWHRGDVSIAQEHFATAILRSRLFSLARGWDRGAGPRALLLCPPGERHEIGLLLSGLALRSEGWRITFLGADTPGETAVETAARLQPRLVLVAAWSAAALEGMLPQLRSIAEQAELVLAGPGADEELAARCRGRLAPAGPIETAHELARSL
jgi:DNA-binding transcriptional MerR regulator